jgi:uncharacterized phiE125 gp8 family phage protein
MNEQEHEIKPLYSLILLEEFKLILGIDDRDDKLSRFCLVTSTHTIEQHCKRRLCEKTHHQSFSDWSDLTLYLNEYPVTEILMVSSLYFNKELEVIEPEFYHIELADELENIPYQISLSPSLRRLHAVTALKVIYKAGYNGAAVPADLKSACLELAAWNFNRYKSRKIGVINNEKSTSNNVGFEMSLPENVKSLLEPYRRKTI